MILTTCDRCGVKLQILDQFTLLLKTPQMTPRWSCDLCRLCADALYEELRPPEKSEPDPS